MFYVKLGDFPEMFCTLILVYPFQQSMLCGIPCYNYEHHGFNKASIDTYCTKIDCRDEFIRYRIAVCDAKSKFCDAKWNVHALADCVPVCDQRSSLVRDFFLLVAGHSICATFRVCHTLVVSLIFVCAVLITSCKLRLTE